ncbi:hypothetical protein [Tautonia sociabilis]|uniref:Protein-tyrosine-phosphatase n=1 Tax=Tautonia sociabilis TaxID=2080755 RepID=A0A432MKJ3_9BACT|nr:hypothetical protein [Tautonia sociabilis]RUL87943.1 hypothetical protein TsocGM_09440 [Tautonia sociabilis]
MEPDESPVDPDGWRIRRSMKDREHDPATLDASCRRRLLPTIAEHVARLAASIRSSDPVHREAGDALTAWIAANFRPGRSLPVVAVCTGNSRRSVLAAAMGNVAAAYWGLPEVRFHSGGTHPIAVDPRTVAALRAIGVEVEPTGAEAPTAGWRGGNAVYRFCWGTPRDPADASELASVVFSKHYNHPGNPQAGFAALMVCDEADVACPAVRGASLRLSMPFADPKAHDGTPDEAANYAERRDEIGRLLLWVMMRARHRLSCR